MGKESPDMNLITPEEETNNLIEENMNLVRHIAKKFYGSYAHCSSDRDDILSAGCVGLIKAARAFNPNRRTFSAFAGRCIENEILMDLRRRKKSSGEFSIDEPIHTDSEGNELAVTDFLPSEYDMEKTIVLQYDLAVVDGIILNYIPQPNATMLLLRGCSLGQKEIANRFKISRSYVSRICKATSEEIKNHMATMPSQICGEYTIDKQRDSLVITTVEGKTTIVMNKNFWKNLLFLVVGEDTYSDIL